MTEPQPPEAEIQRWKDRIGRMDRLKLARLYQFAPIGHVVFRQDLPLHTIFTKRFKELGGMTFEIKQQLLGPAKVMEIPPVQEKDTSRGRPGWGSGPKPIKGGWGS